MTHAAVEAWIDDNNNAYVGFPNGAIPHQVIAAAKALTGVFESEGLSFVMPVSAIIQHREFIYVEDQAYAQESWKPTQVHGLAGPGRTPVWRIDLNAYAESLQVDEEVDE